MAAAAAAVEWQETEALDDELDRGRQRQELPAASLLGLGENDPASSGSAQDEHADAAHADSASPRAPAGVAWSPGGAGAAAANGGKEEPLDSTVRALVEENAQLKGAVEHLRLDVQALQRDYRDLLKEVAWPARKRALSPPLHLR